MHIPEIFQGKVSRRALLQRFSMLGISAPLAHFIFQREGEAAVANTPSFKVTESTFSVSERDRRWTEVRRIMSKPEWNFDAILAPGSGDRAYPRYLTQIGGRGGSADVILLRDPSKPVYAFPGGGRNKAFWEKRIKSWLADGKLVFGDDDGSKAVIATLKKIDLAKSGVRIGVAKLTGSRFDPEGLVSATFMDELRKALPGVEFLPMEKWGPDAGPVDEPAMHKSAEEHVVVRRSAEAAENAIKVILRMARPPAKIQADIWLPTFAAMFAETGEDPTRLSISFDEPSNSTLGAPVADPLKEGQIISQEIDATVQGYRAQVNHSIFVGGAKTPGYGYYKAAMEAAIKIFSDSIAFIVPGKTTCGQVADYYNSLAEKFGAEDRSGVMLHSSGIDNLSRPRLGPSNSRKDSDIVLVPGMTFDLKPAIRMKRDKIQDVGKENRIVQIGEHVLITEKGVMRIGKRELKPLTTKA